MTDVHVYIFYYWSVIPQSKEMLAVYIDKWTVLWIIIWELPIRIYTELELFCLVLVILSKAIPLRYEE